MTILLVAEHDHQHLDPTFVHILSAVKALNQAIKVVVAGHHCATVATEAAGLQGVASVSWLDAPEFECPLAEQFSPLVAKLAQDCEYLVMASTTLSKNVLPRAAALLGVGQVSEVTKILSSDTFEHPIYAGNAIETLQILDHQKVLSIRATAFAAETNTQSPCEISKVETTILPCLTRFVSRKLSQSDRPELTNASIIVSGGRGLQSKEQFKIVEDLADKLGAAVGASRAAVDAGYISNDHQVGQTGKIVAPKLYFAIGISGAIQHIAGIKDTQVIVAINQDENAPIFEVANYGLIGDLFTIIPKLVQELQQRGICP